MERIDSKQLLVLSEAPTFPQKNREILAVAMAQSALHWFCGITRIALTCLKPNPRSFTHALLLRTCLQQSLLCFFVLGMCTPAMTCLRLCAPAPRFTARPVLLRALSRRFRLHWSI
jgi:hypothetical protein